MTIFRAYDVRGLAETELTNPIAWALGRALAELTLARGDKNIYVGQDVRLSSPRLANAVSAGLQAGGVSVRQITPGPTPLLYFAAHQAESDFPTHSGVMVTGSHNPPEYNGFKMLIGGGTLFGDDIQRLGERVRHFVAQAPQDVSFAGKQVDRYPAYVDYVKNNVKPQRRLKVVVDAGNGAGGELGVRTYEAMGCEVIPLFCNPDGRFPNHHPDPTVPDNLKHLIAKVRETGADLGIGFDGDADRIGAVTATGRIMFGDHLVLYYSRDILRERPGATIISEVKSSQILYDLLEQWGAKPIMWKTGHSLIKAKLKQEKAALAGEMSGHIFFNDRFFGFDDAIYSGARLIEGLASRGESLDAFMDMLPPMINTPELRLDCSDESKFSVVERFTAMAKREFNGHVNDIDGVRIKLMGGWALLRASNTQPVLVMRFEAQDKNGLQQIRNRFADMMAQIDKEIVVPQV